MQRKARARGSWRCRKTNLLFKEYQTRLEPFGQAFNFFSCNSNQLSADEWFVEHRLREAVAPLYTGVVFCYSIENTISKDAVASLTKAGRRHTEPRKTQASPTHLLSDQMPTEAMNQAASIYYPNAIGLRLLYIMQSLKNSAKS